VWHIFSKLNFMNLLQQEKKLIPQRRNEDAKNTQCSSLRNPSGFASLRESISSFYADLPIMALTFFLLPILLAIAPPSSAQTLSPLRPVSLSDQTSLPAQTTSVAGAPQALLIERIEIQGNTKTRPQVIRRYLSMKEGTAITPEIFSRDYDALVATHFFKRVEFSSKPGSAPGKVVMVIEVQERRWPWLEVAGGFSELEGWYFIPIGVRFDNIFGGGGIGGGRTIIADRTAGFYWHYLEQEIFRSNLDFQMKLGSFTHSYIHYLNNQELLQDIENDNLTLAFSGHRGWSKHLSSGFIFNTWQPAPTATFTANDSTITSLPPPLVTAPLEKSNSAFVRLQLDTRDHALFPRRGTWGALQFEKTLASSREDNNDFSRVLIDMRWYAAVGRNVLALHAKAGRVSESAPFYERFYLGGAYSVRGYAERSLTPLGWGTKMALGQVEMRFPISGSRQNPALSGAVFLDAGHINNYKNPETGRELFLSAGYGFRLKLPVIGLLRCDFAYPLDRDDFRFHISLGHTF
jgi:outer membrane protein insertion porin family